MTTYRFVSGVSSVILGWLSISLCASAQIVPDSTLPNNSVVNLEENFFTITGGTEVGTNLFHSFAEFSVPTNGTTFFDNAVEIDNIITRVTGGRLSNIDGSIEANGTANLFLINPSGIVFGPNASLSIGGSFWGSTANSITFEDGTEFSATNPQQPLLSINVPVGLQYGANAADIRVEGRNLDVSEGENLEVSEASSLEVSEGETLALFGGNLTLYNANLSAPGGNIQLGGLLGEGAIALTENGDVIFPDSIARGNVEISNKSKVDVRSGGGGNLIVQAGNVSLSGDSSLLAGIAAGSGEEGVQAGTIVVNATGAVTLESQSSIVNNILENGTGIGGNIFIVANSLSLTNGSSLDAGTFGQGNAGNIFAIVNENVTLERSLIESNSPEGTGDAGNISISARGSINISQRSTVYSNAYNGNNGQSGRSGNIELIGDKGIEITSESSLYTQSQSDEVDSYGNIRLISSEGSVILNLNPDELSQSFRDISARNLSSGLAGDILIEAGDKAIVLSSGLISDAYNIKNGDEAGGISGDIDIYGNRGVEITNSLLASESSNNSNNSYGNIRLIALEGSVTLNYNSDYPGSFPKISTTNYGSGLAGDIFINARDEVTILNSQLNSDGNLGRIYIGDLDFSSLDENPELSEVLSVNVGSLPRQVMLDENSVLTTNNSESKTAPNESINAGQIAIGARENITIQGESRLEALTSRTGDAGAILLQTDGDLVVSNSEINSSVQPQGVGTGGGVAISVGSFSLTDNAKIDAGTFGQGNAGDVLIDADDSIELNGNETRIYSDAAANSTGQGGTITLNADSFSLSDGAQLITSTGNAQPGGDIELNIDEDIFLGEESSITSNGKATGNAGNIRLNSNSIEMQQATVEASTASGNGGGIEINTRGLIQMRDRSVIQTDAGRGQQLGNGGAISLNSYFLIGINNSDITANAYEGSGGFIDINTRGTIGFQGREELTPFNDITAFSERSPELSGIVAINSTAVDTAGLVTLSENPVDVTGLVGEDACAKGEGSEFVVTGRGGLPPTPADVLTNEPQVLEWTRREGEAANRETDTGEIQTPQRETVAKNTSVPGSANSNSRERLLEATGWEIDEDGKVILVADAPTVTPSSPAFRQPGCHR